MRLLLVRRCFLRLKNREQSYIIYLDEAVGKFTTSHMKCSADITFICRIARTQSTSNLKPVQSVVEWIAFQFNE